MDWLLTVPLLLIELVLVMGLPAEETSKMTWRLGAASALMVARLFCLKLRTSIVEVTLG